MVSTGVGRGVFQARFEFVAGSLFRQKGQYTSFQREAGQANKRLADQLQKKVALALRHGLVRKRVSTGVLERVTRDPKNRYATKEGFGVGIIKYLDESDAKYWEQIERGSEVHLGQRLSGVWTDSISYAGPTYRAGEPFSQRAPRGRYIEFGSPQGHAFLPVGMKEGRRLLREQAKSGTHGGNRVRGVIRRPIEKEEYYLRGWEEFDWLKSVQREYDAIFRQSGWKVTWVNGQLIRTPVRGAAAAQRRAARSQSR